jgi:hypothetical protein
VVHEAALGWWVAALCTAALLWLIAGRAFARARARRTARRRGARAVRGERAAENLLADLGFTVLSRQAGLSWTIECDGQPYPVELRADLLVERGGQRYVAEVKTGAQAPRLENAATRRQLLEYAIAYRVDSVLLVEVESDAVREIRFPREL